MEQACEDGQVDGQTWLRLDCCAGVESGSLLTQGMCVYMQEQQHGPHDPWHSAKQIHQHGEAQGCQGLPRIQVDT